MQLLWKFLLKAAANAGALWVAATYIQGFGIAPRPLLVNLGATGIPPLIQWLVAGGVGLAIVNGLARPILKAAGALLPLITFALLSVIANLAFLFLADRFLAEITLDGLQPLILAALLIGIVNVIF